MTNVKDMTKLMEKDIESLKKWLNDRINSMRNKNYTANEIEGALAGYTYQLAKETLKIAKENGNDELIHGFILSHIGALIKGDLND